ncbi:unnamed protein product [Blepharisma stoltei]|uniref:Uncharacterized protein n=1 Tax=Blepharisma stoltei TaxID=1481888 RepID=A0AAU9K324_9CILI|nr:unnamed protein product [Blepharisma stoltei]
MISGKCFMKGCIFIPRNKCECNNTTTLFCDLHALDHIKTPSKTGHAGLDLYFNPSKETKSITARKILILLADLRKFKAEFLHKSNEIVDFLLNSIQNTLIQLNKIEQDCKNMLQVVLSNSEILDVPTESKIEKILKLSEEEAELELGNWEVPEMSINTENIKSFIENNIKVELEVFKDLGSICKSNILWFWYNNGLNKFDLDTGQTLPQSEFFGNFQKWETLWQNIANIRNNKLHPRKNNLYHGRNQAPYKFHMHPTGQVLACNYNNSLYLINKNFDIIQIGKQNVNYTQSGFASSKNLVYVFGNGIASKFDLKTYELTDLAASDYIYNLNSTSCIEYQNKVIIVDFKLSGVLIYDIENNNYSFVQKIYLSQNCYKLILKGNEKLFLIDFGSNIFESNAGDASNWNLIGYNTLQNLYIQSTICQHKGIIYFLVDFQLWRFNLKTKEVEIANQDILKIHPNLIPVGGYKNLF